MVRKKSAIFYGLIGALAFLALFSQAQALTAPKTWVWLCKTGVTYKWTLGGATTGEATWTFTEIKNISVSSGRANGSISAPSFTSTAGVALYSIDYTSELYDLSNANYLRTGGWLPYTSLSKTSGVTGNVTWPPTYMEQMTLLNRSLYTYVDLYFYAAPPSSSITYLIGEAAAWRLSYVNGTNVKQMLNWTIAVTGLVKDFTETNAAGEVIASAAYQYPPVGIFGFDPTVEASLWIGIITLAVGIVYTLGTKGQDKRDDAEETALKKMVAEKAGSAPAPKKEGE